MFQNKSLILVLFAALLLLLVGCKKVGKEVSKGIAEKVVKESVEGSSEIVAKRVGKSSLKELGEKGIKKLNYDDFVTLLKKEFPELHISFSKLDKRFQKDIVKTINEKPQVLDVLLSSKTIIDEFVIATAKTPSLAKNVNFFSYYVTHPRFVSDVVLQKADGAVHFVSKADKIVLGKYRDGVLEVVDPLVKGGRFSKSHLLSGDLIPNTLYKVKGQMGSLYQLQTDAVGNVVTAQGRNLSPDELVANILRRNSDLNLGASWPTTFKKIKQHSRGADLDVHVRFKYSDNNPNPRSAKIVVKRGDKEVVNELFENANHLVSPKYTSASNASLLKGLQKKLNISEKKLANLQNLMDADDGFAEFIHANPEFNIKRWLNTRNSVDNSLIKKTSKGRFPPNAKEYAGNVYYFEPYLNPKLADRLAKNNGLAVTKNAGYLSREQLKELDRLYPDGVPFSKSGYPDFTGVAARGADGKPIAIDIKSLSGDSKVDIAKAETIYQQMGNHWEGDFTWHHVEGTTSLLRVPTIIHQLVDHAGSMATL